ncbi:MAG: hypothetical protein K0R38_1478 [Polyangiaceae bacterium]|nr:hypothetical protein [Polyangiaceae bacterium]
MILAARLTPDSRSLGSRLLSPLRRASSLLPLAAAALCATPAQATTRSFVTTHESRVLAPGRSELAPWTTLRVGRSRYYSRLEGQLQLEHGLTRGLELSLFWNFETETQDVVADSLTRQVSRVTRSELSGAAAELKYQLTSPTVDALGSALQLRATLGPNHSALWARLIVDRQLGGWLFAANVGARLDLVPRRNASGAELATAFVLEPTLAAAYQLAAGASIGLELRAPLGLSGDEKSSTLFGGPVARVSDDRWWAALGVQPQLLAFSGDSDGSRLDLNGHERLELRLLAGFLL